jgi:chromate transport protein ChrA
VSGTHQTPVKPTAGHRVSLSQFCAYFLRLGTFGFGGPIALAGYMERDLVEQRSWISREEYLEGLTLAQLAPGPLAAQLAIYLGYIRAGTLGASLVGLAFIGPSFVMVVALAAAYTHYGGLPWVQGAFYGIGAAVIAIIARSAYKLARLTLKQDRVPSRYTVGKLFKTGKGMGGGFRPQGRTAPSIGSTARVPRPASASVRSKAARRRRWRRWP